LPPNDPAQDITVISSNATMRFAESARAVDALNAP
jgi:hypothetical protein